MLGIVVDGGDEGAMQFMSKLNLFYEATSLGGVESLIEVPATSSHMAMPVDVRIAAGIEPSMPRSPSNDQLKLAIRGNASLFIYATR